jgi:excisionase family DNA binding protein
MINMAEVKDVLDIQGACELLGISIKTFQKLLREETIPGRKIGREWRFSRQALIEWIGKGSSKA